MRTLAALLAASYLAAEVATAHDDLIAEGVDAAETGRLLEVPHEKLSAHFGAAPEERLRVEVRAPYEALRAAFDDVSREDDAVGGRNSELVEELHGLVVASVEVPDHDRSGRLQESVQPRRRGTVRIAYEAGVGPARTGF